MAGSAPKATIVRIPITAVRAIAPAVAFALIVTIGGRWGEAVSMPLVNLLAILVAVVVGIGGGEVLLVLAVSFFLFRAYRGRGRWIVARVAGIYALFIGFAVLVWSGA